MKAIEPDFLAQTAEPKTQSAAFQWVRLRADEGRERGITYFRYTKHPTKNLHLLEGWKEFPEKQGEPRWQETYPKETEREKEPQP